MKKLFIIITSAVLGIILALSAVFFIIKSLDKVVDTGGTASLTSSLPQSTNSSPQEDESNPQALPDENPEVKLFFNITEPKSKNFTTKSASVTFKGKSNVTTGVSLNGKPIKQARNIDGSFSVTEKLEYGNNKFVFSAGEFSETFNITRKYTVIKSYSPKSASYDAGKKFTVTVTARENATVTATFNGKKIDLNPNNAADGFAKFKGSFTLPDGNLKDLNLGKIKFKATYKKQSETYYSQNIICKKDKKITASNSSVTPKDDDYISVGSGIITEIVAPQAETFSGKGSKDISKPYYNYLPKGTLDYGSAEYDTVKREGDTYKLITLRCGKKVYKYRYDKPPKTKVTVAKQYVGTLPDHNELAVATLEENTNNTILTLDTLWKAPFDFKLKKQSYNSDYTVSDVTYSYVDITFNYATKFDGEVKISKDNPLFKKAKIIKNDYDYTLRLYLRKQGGFYGWDAYYNKQNQLVFEFLHPKKITLCDNEYGADLTGVRILIDVGHGGADPGTARSTVRKYCEASRNLYLAKLLKTELESIGATVYMTRESDKTCSADYKTEMLRKLKPDYCIAIHHDSNNSSRLNGMGVYYYYPFSKNAAKYVLEHSLDTGLYKDKTFKWHYYFMSRVSVCPVVLTENGYYSNDYDYRIIKDNKANAKKAKALAYGVVEYFASIQ